MDGSTWSKSSTCSKCGMSVLKFSKLYQSLSSMYVIYMYLQDTSVICKYEQQLCRSVVSYQHIQIHCLDSMTSPGSIAE